MNRIFTDAEAPARAVTSRGVMMGMQMFVISLAGYFLPEVSIPLATFKRLQSTVGLTAMPTNTTHCLNQSTGQSDK